MRIAVVTCKVKPPSADMAINNNNSTSIEMDGNDERFCSSNIISPISTSCRGIQLQHQQIYNNNNYSTTTTIPQYLNYLLPAQVTQNDDFVREVIQLCNFHGKSKQDLVALLGQAPENLFANLSLATITTTNNNVGTTTSIKTTMNNSNVGGLMNHMSLTNITGPSTSSSNIGINPAKMSTQQHSRLSGEDYSPLNEEHLLIHSNEYAYYEDLDNPTTTNYSGYNNDDMQMNPPELILGNKQPLSIDNSYHKHHRLDYNIIKRSPPPHSTTSTTTTTTFFNNTTSCCDNNQTSQY